MKLIRLSNYLLLWFTAIGALYGGWMLVSDPSGDSLGFGADWLSGSPFKDYLVPGIVLFSIFGAGSIATAMSGHLGWKRFQTLVEIEGIMLMIWISVQTLTIRHFHFLQLVFAVIGIYFVVTGIFFTPQLKKQREN